MKRTSTIASIFAAAVFAVAAAGFVGCTSLLGDFEVTAGTGEAGTGTKANGAACASGSECTSSFCTDGVCCESSCSGTCESCKIEPGKCLPVPDGQNPDNECKPEPLPDAGAGVEPDADIAPLPDAGGTEGGIEAGQPDSGGNEINLPDGGVTQDESKCSVGVCNGNRACRFPDSKTNCGTQFCNSSTQAAGYQCDGKGHCLLEVQTCKDFVCENNECLDRCANSDDCQSTHFCDGATFVCQPRKGNGLSCGNPNECQSGFCVNDGSGPGVCCNSDCGAVPGGKCKNAGSVGQCRCDASLGCGAAACRLFYRDSDGDTFGDKTGTVALGTAVAGCEGGTPPVGYVASKDDCDDGDSNVRPNQTAYFGTPNAKVGFDYNCNGTLEKAYNEYDGSSCQFCEFDDRAQKCFSRATCSVLNQQSRLTCKPYKSIIIGGSGITCGYSTIPQISNTSGFITTVNCGVTSSSYRTCGKCISKSGAPQVTSSSVQQQCH